MKIWAASRHLRLVIDAVRYDVQHLHIHTSWTQTRPGCRSNWVHAQVAGCYWQLVLPRRATETMPSLQACNNRPNEVLRDLLPPFRSRNTFGTMTYAIMLDKVIAARSVGFSTGRSYSYGQHPPRGSFPIFRLADVVACFIFNYLTSLRTHARTQRTPRLWPKGSIGV